MKPFMLKRSSQFRAALPPALSSGAWAREFQETKDFGSATSSVRTPDETAIAYFWNANVINQYNQAFRDLAEKKGFDLVQAARLLAMGDLVGTDALIACFDTKYHDLFWRPYTAIRNADIDGNAATTADPTWTPLLATPNHPEYAAADGCITGAEAEVFAAVLHTRHVDLDIPGATLGGTTLTTSRHFATTGALVREIVNARVWAGLHYRGSGLAGVRSGAKWRIGPSIGSSPRRTADTPTIGPGSDGRLPGGTAVGPRPGPPGDRWAGHGPAGPPRTPRPSPARLPWAARTWATGPCPSDEPTSDGMETTAR